VGLRPEPARRSQPGCDVFLSRVTDLVRRREETQFRDALPKGGTGKILKAALREPFWAGLDARVH
jgi:acyl-coenzyme A synthetase/AMP-(fatty) acid ligase